MVLKNTNEFVDDNVQADTVASRLRMKRIFNKLQEIIKNFK